MGLPCLIDTITTNVNAHLLKEKGKYNNELFVMNSSRHPYIKVFVLLTINTFNHV